MVNSIRGLWSSILLIVFLVGSAPAQSVVSLKVGTFNPKAAKPGFIIGIVTGRQVDERVDIGLGADLFIRKFTQESTVSADTSLGGTQVAQIQTEIDYSMFGLPIMFHVNVRILPLAVVRPYVNLAAGYEIVFSSEANYITGAKDRRLYGGFGWQLMLGGEYPLGSASALLGEVFYNGCKVKRNKGSNELGYPIHEELDFSGLGFRIGMRFGGY